MSAIRASELPAQALLQRYRMQGDYTDCYAIDVPQPVSHAAFVEAFYTTPVFRLERALIALLASLPSQDAEARELAAGRRERFSAWTVEARAPGQLLMCDVAGSTRSWLMAEEAGQGTHLYFGSAVVRKRQGGAFHALLGFHRLYSRLLLRAAAARALRAG